MNLYSFSRSEKLKSDKAIASLFETGKNLSVWPIRVIYRKIQTSEKSPVKVAFSVPKKNFKRAVDRNLLKRRMREAYRLNKQLLVHGIEASLPQLEIMMIYQAQHIEEYEKINRSIIELLQKISSILLIDK